MGWGYEGDGPPSYDFYRTSPLPSKVMPPHGAHLPLKNEAPPPQSEKQAPLPPLKREAPFHEMIPRKSTIIKNLKSS